MGMSVGMDVEEYVVGESGVPTEVLKDGRISCTRILRTLARI
jgi:hypothetical protein